MIDLSVYESFHTPEVWNFRVNYIEPKRYTIIRPYWIVPVPDKPRCLNDEQIISYLKSIKLDEYVDIVLNTIHRMETDSVKYI